MRILVTAQAAWSHVVPVMLPCARAARDAGHEVTVATSADLAPAVDVPGVRTLVLPGAEPLGAVMARVAGEFPTGGTGPELFARGFASTLGPQTAEDLLRLCADRPPDLVVRDVSEFGGHLAAAVLGVPSRVVDVGPMSHAAHPVVLAALDVERARFGLAPLGPGEVWGDGRIGVVPESFYPASRRVPGTVYAQVPPPHPRPVSRAVAGLPGDLPLVVVSLGSNVALLPGASTLLDTIVAALERLPVAAVVGTGSDGPGTAAPNVVLEPFPAQQELLGTADLLVTHAGFNGVREAITAGVPTVCLPLFADQPGTAARVEELGVGRALDPGSADAGSLADAIRSTLADPGIRARSRELQREMLALPSLADVVVPSDVPVPG